MQGDWTRETPSLARLRGTRLVEVDVRRLTDVADLESLRADVFAAIRRAGPAAVICADYRWAHPFSRDVAAVWSRAMRAANRGIVRSAGLLDPANAIVNLQIERVVRCAANPARRLFTQLESLRDWVGVVLSEPERQALAELFSRDG